MKMKLLLRCRSLSETRRFYAETLGFKVSDGEEGTLHAERGKACFIFTSEDLWSGEPRCTGTIYLGMADTESLEDYYAAIKERVEIRWPLQNMPYGTREFGILDCNGYHLAFAV